MPQPETRRRTSAPVLSRRSALILTGTLIAASVPRKLPAAGVAPEKAVSLSELTPHAPAPLPELTVTDSEGNERSLSDFRGLPTVLYLWATWCDRCRDELRALRDALPLLRQSSIQLLPVAVDFRGPETVQPFLADLKLSDLPVYYDQRRSIPGALEETSLPLTLFLSADMNETTRHTGPLVWTDSDLVNRLRYLCG